MQWHSIEQKTRKYAKGCGIFFICTEYKKQVLNTGLDVVKTASKKVVHKTGELLGNKIADEVTKSNDDKILNQEPVEEMIKQKKKRDEVSKKLIKVL